MTLQTISTIEIFPDERLTLEERIEKWCVQLCRALQASYDEHYDSDRYDFTIRLGRKYWKIHDGNGVHAFVDRKTGEVYKPASYKAPAKHVRYDLRLIKDRERCFSNADWAGGYLYLRG